MYTVRFVLIVRNREITDPCNSGSQLPILHRSSRSVIIRAMNIERHIATAVREAATELPVITIVGPRQSGKTTLAKMLFPDKPYRSLEDPDVRRLAGSDPRRFLEKLPDGAILDEVQRVPDLLSYIQGIVDEKGVNGLFVLTGSSNLLLMKSVSQTLAGRCAIFTLLPFSLGEADGLQAKGDMLSSILAGGYPRFLAGGIRHKTFFGGYINTYVERDVHQLLKIKDTLLFTNFLRILVGRIGTILDVTSISNDTGVSTKTVMEWLSILHTSYICFLLPPWYENRGKRLVKSPKLYFYDTGLACALAEIGDVEQLNRDPLRGGLFENLVILEAMKRAYNNGTRPNLYFYRDSKGIEVDLVEHSGRKLIPTEIKSSATFNPDFCKNLSVFAERYKDVCGQSTVIYGGDESFAFKGVSVRPFYAY